MVRFEEDDIHIMSFEVIKSSFYHSNHKSWTKF